jgi:predicted DNA-binding transcriptional regulator YafY
MSRFDRALGILLHLRSGKGVSALDLAQHFGVSRRTIYRDIETLSALGVPVYAERGREGGIRLLEGYFLPPVMFSKGEAVSLLLSLTLFRSLHSQPYPTDLETAEKKLLAAMPDTLRTVLTEAQKVIGFEGIPSDTFHPERAVPSQPVASTEQEESAESKTTTIFLQAVLERRTVSMHYRSPYRARTENISLEPFGVFWDRDHWYLVGKLLDQEQDIRIWRADRVLEITPRSQAITNHPDFDVRSVLGRSWLKAAMQRWTQEALVRIRLSQQQAERLKKDWYYQHATFEQLSEHSILMTFGEDDQEVVLELLRWLGPGAELIEPMAWRVALRAGLAQMLAEYDDGKQNLS